MPRYITQKIGLALFSIGLIVTVLTATYALYLYLSSPADDEIIITTSSAYDSLSPSQSGNNSLYPGNQLPVRQWSDPRGTFPLNQLSGGPFVPLSSIKQPIIHGLQGRALEIQIPQLNLQASIVELALFNLGSSLEYETPKFTVGHIPATPNPGSKGSGWYFGHLDNPVGGEGNVFSQLPKIAELLRTGDEVHILLSTENDEYLYSAYKTDLLPENELKITNSLRSEVVLVTCFPRLTYEKRFLVHAELIGVRSKT
tara:strand:+ start:477 stop:1244 length:768 start_codon:yes stop_codon:yes gene_type:complete